MGKADDVRKMVSESYSAAVKAALARRKARFAGRASSGTAGGGSDSTGKPPRTTGTSCCGSRVPAGPLVDMAGYSREALAALPPDAVASSFGCGNPVALAAIREGDIVLDLGSGAGIDLLLAAKLAGPTGKVIGVDMTAEMVEQARKNVAAAGLGNVEVRQGLIENLPVEPESVDLVISNCVINLSPEKGRVFREIYRVLKPGGRISISDTVAEQLPEWVTRTAALYSSCIAGAIPESAYLAGLREVGLEDVRVMDRLVYDADQIAVYVGSVEGGGCGCGCTGGGGEEISRQVAGALVGKMASIKVGGVKPAREGK